MRKRSADWASQVVSHYVASLLLWAGIFPSALSTKSGLEQQLQHYLGSLRAVLSLLDSWFPTESNHNPGSWEAPPSRLGFLAGLQAGVTSHVLL